MLLLILHERNCTGYFNHCDHTIFDCGFKDEFSYSMPFNAKWALLDDLFVAIGEFYNQAAVITSSSSATNLATCPALSGKCANSDSKNKRLSRSSFFSMSPFWHT